MKNQLPWVYENLDNSNIIKLPILKFDVKPNSGMSLWKIQSNQDNIADENNFKKVKLKLSDFIFELRSVNEHNNEIENFKIWYQARPSQVITRIITTLTIK